MAPPVTNPGLSRRDFLSRSAHGFGAMALWHLLAAEGGAGARPHFAPRAKNVIFIFMAGGPSQLDLLDPKPRMAGLHGQPMPASLVMAKKRATGGVLETVMASPRSFQRYGQSGIEFSEHREYTTGDDFRYLDWNVYARHGDLLLKRLRRLSRSPGVALVQPHADRVRR